MTSTRPRDPRMFSVVLATWLAMLLAAGPCWGILRAPELPDPGKPRMSREQQQKLGLQVAAQVYTQTPVLPDSSPETQYIQALGKRLVDTIPPEHSWPFQFHVIAQKEINAFALPGGPMFVNIGTIVAADNEAQLAGVMAHEMSHVYMQHSAKQQDKSSLLQSLAGIAGAAAALWEEPREPWRKPESSSARERCCSSILAAMKRRPTRSEPSFCGRRDSILWRWRISFRSWKRKAETDRSS